jgi:hypothetical protein
MNIRKRLELPDREPKQKRDVNLEKFTERYNSKAIHAQLCEEFEYLRILCSAKLRNVDYRSEKMSRHMKNKLFAKRMSLGC